jgi:shikimate dehydrogenase
LITGATRVAAVIGDPVRHSLSPALHNAAYRALDLDWVYVAFEVPSGKSADALAAVRGLGLVGLSVTMPHKEAVAAQCDALTDDATALRSANTVTRWPDGTLLGSSTDGDGFIRSMRDAGHDIEAGARVLLVGAGGAARAVALACGRRGARVTVAARRPDAALAAAALAGGEVVPWDDRDDAVATSDVVVNATPVGMGGDDALPIAAASLRPALVVADLVYHPLDTPLLAAAAAGGAQTVDGLGMLVHQAALQVECWSGREPPVATMRAAAESVLAKR